MALLALALGIALGVALASAGFCAVAWSRVRSERLDSFQAKQTDLEKAFYALTKHVADLNSQLTTAASRIYGLDRDVEQAANKLGLRRYVERS